MPDAKKTYVIAQKAQVPSNPLEPLHDVLKAVKDVDIVGVAPKRAQVVTTDRGVAELRSRLGDWYHIEESSDRDLA